MGIEQTPPKVVCHSCGNPDLEHYRDTEFWDRHDDSWSFSVYRCKKRKCAAYTIVTFDYREKCAQLPKT